MTKRTWYEKYIGYQFCTGWILDDIFYFEDENGKNRKTGYGCHNPETGEESTMDLYSFRKIVIAGTCLPK